MMRYCYRYSSLLHMAEGRLKTVMASSNDENLQPANAPASGLGDEVRCVAFEPAHSASTVATAETLVGEKVKSEIESVILEAAHNASTVAKAEQLVGEKIESVILDAAHNACKPGCGEEEKSKAEGWREQNCGILEAKVGLCQKSDSLKYFTNFM